MKRNFGLFFGFVIMVMVAIFTTAACDTGNSSPETYKIGDTGPAGGIVFYDKGTTSDGWRYLEAEPASTAFPRWNYVAYDSEYIDILIGGTSTEIGSGKQNTEIILEKLSNWGESLGKVAAERCADLEYGGKTDWFLPSKDELNEMYLSLRDREDWSGWTYKTFWSSSEADNGPAPWAGKESAGKAWAQDFSSGDQMSHTKDGEDMVRAVRAF